MEKIRFNDNWNFMEGSVNPMMSSLHGDNNDIKSVDLPHDAMLLETRNRNEINKAQTGFFPGGNYCYIKNVFVPKEWESRVNIIEFEGVYAEAKVYINDDFAMSHLNGYSNFYVRLNDYLRYGEENTIKVIANNTSVPNTRWYSGSGIYRNVNLFSSEYIYIPCDGIKITTPQIDKDLAVIEIKIKLKNEFNTSHQVEVETSIENICGDLVKKQTSLITLYSAEAVNILQRIEIENPDLWDINSPNLYKCKVKVKNKNKIFDSERITFGIRKIELSPTKGFQLNGVEVKLRGSCIHHDNGVLGAKTFEEAEYRRVKIMKDAGFNCIRSAHQPLSKAMIDACDKLGVLVIDELTDMWNNSKNTNDYSKYFNEYWEKDVESMINKDYNHPSVIMYCTGNEIKEAGTARGAHLSRLIRDKIKELDPNRYTVSAINGLLSASSRLGEFFADLQEIQKKKVEEQASDNKRKDNVDDQGSNQLNNLMSLMVGPIADMFATHKIMDEAISEFEGTTDVVGYNYMTERHTKINESHPEYVVMGTETFPPEIARLWRIVEENSYVIGDMTWTGYDYLGEAGVGIFYYDGGQSFSNHWPDLLANVGDIDITGHRRPMSYYREIAYGLRKEPYIAVQRVDKYGINYTPTPWIGKDYLSSWTWKGFENKPAIVDVFSDADEVELLINGKSLGKKVAGRDNEWKASFEVEYHSGEVKAVNYRNNIPSEVMELFTANSKLSISVNKQYVELDSSKREIEFIEIEIIDDKGIINTQYDEDVSIFVEGGIELIGFGSANPMTENLYTNNVWKPWDGKLLAVIRAIPEKGDGQVVIQSNDLKTFIKVVVN